MWHKRFTSFIIVVNLFCLFVSGRTQMQLYFQPSAILRLLLMMMLFTLRHLTRLSASSVANMASNVSSVTATAPRTKTRIAATTNLLK